MANHLRSIPAASTPQVEAGNAFLTKLERVVSLSSDDRQALIEVCRDVRELQANRYVVRESERPRHVHLILSGWAARCDFLANGARQITAFLLPGDLCDQHVTILGEMDHNIRTITPARIAYLPNGELEEIARIRPQIARALWWSTLVDEAVLRAWISNIGRRAAYERRGHLVCELQVRLENIGLVDGDQFQLPLTQEDFADALGLTPVHINRMLRRLRGEGLISSSKPWLTIPDVPRLRRACGFDARYLHREMAPS